MQLCKLRDEVGHTKVGLVRNSQVFTLNFERMPGIIRSGPARSNWRGRGSWRNLSHVLT